MGGWGRGAGGGNGGGGHPYVPQSYFIQKDLHYLCYGVRSVSVLLLDARSAEATPWFPNPVLDKHYQSSFCVALTFSKKIPEHNQ